MPSVGDTDTQSSFQFAALGQKQPKAKSQEPRAKNCELQLLWAFVHDIDVLFYHHDGGDGFINASPGEGPDNGPVLHTTIVYCVRCELCMRMTDGVLRMAYCVLRIAYCVSCIG